MVRAPQGTAQADCKRPCQGWPDGAGTGGRPERTAAREVSGPASGRSIRVAPDPGLKECVMDYVIPAVILVVVVIFAVRTFMGKKQQ